MVPPRANRVFEQLFIAALWSADRVHGRAAAVTYSPPDDRLLLQVPVAGGRCRRGLVRHRRGRWRFRRSRNLGILLGFSRRRHGRRSLGEKRKLVWRWGGGGGRNRFVRLGRRLFFWGRGRSGVRREACRERG